MSFTPITKLLALAFEAMGYSVSMDAPADSEVVADLKISSTSAGYNEIVLAYKASPDTGWFWVFPSQTKKPLHLLLPQPYPIQTQTIGTATKLAYSFGLGSSQADGKIYLQWRNNSPIEKLLAPAQASNFVFYVKPAIRIGEVFGALGNNDAVTHLVKFGLTPKQLQGIENEAAALKKWHGNLPYVDVSALVHFETSIDKGYLISAFGKPKKTKQFDTIGKPHLQFLGTMYERSVMRGPLNFAPFWQQISSQVQELGGMVNKHATDPAKQELPNKLNLNQLTTLSGLLIDTWQQLDDTPEVFVAYAHGNLNPNNCFVSADRFYAYNWEQSHSALPVLFDLFQFYFRDDMLLVGKGDVLVQKSIEQTLKMPEAQGIIKTFLVEPEQYFLMFLLWRLSADALYHSKLFMPNSQSQNLLNVWLKVFDAALERISK